MGALLLDGKKLSLDIENNLKIRVSKLKEDGIFPHLAVILVGEDPASEVYVKNKEKACDRTGIKSTKVLLPSSTTENDILELIDLMNNDDMIHGILVQSPTPPSINEISITEKISPSKDVDGFHPQNLGKLVQGELGGLMPCTPAGIMKLLKHSRIDLTGRKVTVIGRSRIVGMPLALLLAQKGIDATVTIAHSKSKDLADICRESDVLIVAIGRPEVVKLDWIKPGSVIVDVGISRINDSLTGKSRLVGDVSSKAMELASHMTPVPGGVGPMTIAMLLSNTVDAAAKTKFN
ncbi:MAG: bifunctional methylenetetrahydrofolate dehydrogenase/methenyltetrahydrofolate cyclohydrolase FolD [Euryarchaeota archaeon]|nr:bifunctional methylenetetrahydrofolate dehydrogenase/methenyltetrahydrofolate cyclohydrolase FolD [Euryarchaeota archaeon]MBT4802588.1 bifunctional methylenetetrahydrofolate dehydrogenase/methenyltetrahydrofolate cyclohydrolase FolD [Euryarchaeota archaeon]MBT5613413.1 bifunctional methylenetetrahydrofolate dehydrogenase/methenyltetrahydrofolate cyclohydrolase FolD [Euryarchaeota archaeon]MBT6683374.1 bifunctional methylenetetrahydrofolate dehydrogenase/methenyltetrahydrofolate cyclohydrolase